MSTMYSRSKIMFEQSVMALGKVASDTITDWEESSRYGKGIRTTVQTVQRVHNIYRNINEEFLRRQAENNE